MAHLAPWELERKTSHLGEVLFCVLAARSNCMKHSLLCISNQPFSMAVAWKRWKQRRVDYFGDTSVHYASIYF